LYFHLFIKLSYFDGEIKVFYNLCMSAWHC